MAKTAIYLIILVHILIETLTVYAEVPAIIVFGDSTVDAGNNNEISTVLKSNFLPYGRDFKEGRPTGRFSNGRISSDFISEAFGIKPTIPAYLDPSYRISDFATGVSFASAGTGYDNMTSAVLSVLPLWKELEYFKDYQKKLRSHIGYKKANKILSKAVYLISAGTNDFLGNYYTSPVRSSEFSIEQYQNFLGEIARDFITELHRLGARKISLTGLPPMGCLPLERTTNFFLGSSCVVEFNNVAKEFNGKLNGLVTKLTKELKGARLVFLNPYNILLEIINHPISFGFDNSATACCGTGYFEMGYMCDRTNPYTCSDASKYVFWDSFHPTEKTNKIVSHHLVIIITRQFASDVLFPPQCKYK